MRLTIWNGLLILCLSWAVSANAASPKLPKKPQNCPELKNGLISFTPSKLNKLRSAQIWMDDETVGGGPLVFFFHGMGGKPEEAKIVLGEEAFDKIIDSGGMVVAPVSEGLQFEWHLVLGWEENDLYVVDDITACAISDRGIDSTKVFATGFSAGALHTSRMMFLRSEYLTAASIYSGGFLTFQRDPVNQVADHNFPVLLFYGGPNDNAFINFEATTMKMHKNLKTNNHPHMLCNHNKGHKLPNQDGIDLTWEFLSSQTYGTFTPINTLEYCQTFF